MEKKNFYLLVTGCWLLATLFSGCATLPPKESLTAYTLNGTTYYPLSGLCALKNINLEYDTFSKTATLTKSAHKINLMAGDRLVLVDGAVKYMSYPAEIYQGALVVPAKFKTEIIDSLYFKDYPEQKIIPPVLKIKKIVVDAGHGGNDPGAIGRTGLREKDVNLDIAKRLAKLLKADGIEVVLTRSIDKFIPLSGRVAIANNSGADLFISVHSNANRVRNMNGFEVYYVSGNVSDYKRAISAADDGRLNLDKNSSIYPSRNLKIILWDMIYNSSRGESIALARSICRSVSNDLDVKILGIKGAVYQVLKGARMPAILIETGFLSNLDEERKLKNGYYRQKIAESIADGVSNYSKDLMFAEAR